MTYPFEAHMAPARFASYASCSPNREAQRALYLWNIELAQALNTTLGHVEVFLRHAIDTQLRTWNLQQPYLDPMPEVHPRDPRHRYGGASEEWLKHPAKELATLIITGRGRKTSPYDMAYQRAVADQKGLPFRCPPDSGYRSGTWKLGSWHISRYAGLHTKTLWIAGLFTMSAHTTSSNFCTYLRPQRRGWALNCRGFLLGRMKP